jgi:hypothetical protein
VPLPIGFPASTIAEITRQSKAPTATVVGIEEAADIPEPRSP